MSIVELGRPGWVWPAVHNFRILAKDCFWFVVFVDEY